MKKLFNLIIIPIIILNLTGCNKEKEEVETPIDVNSYYNNYVKTNKEADIYAKCTETNCESEFNKIGKIKENVELTLDGITDEYFKIINLDTEYYIKYSDVDKIDTLTEKKHRYKNYIIWNQNVVTNNTTKFYDENGNIIFTLNKSFDLPIFIKDDINKKYYVEYDNELLYITGDDVKEIKNNNNTELKNTGGIAVLNYHFIYKPEESAKCNEILCISKSQFGEHLSYIKNNNYFTPTMKELEMYMDGILQLPKSVFIRLIPSAPASSQAFAIDTISVTFGESLIITGLVVTFLTAFTTSAALSGFVPKLIPPP